MKRVVKLDDLTREDFLEIRRSGIGASEVAGVMGLSPWQTPLSIYVEKVEGLEDQEESLQMELGLELEPFLQRKFTQWLQKNEGVVIMPAQEETPFEPTFEEKYMYAHDDYPFIRCTPDDMFIHPEDGLVGVEYKTSSEYMKDEWGEDEVPTQYYLQVQANLFVTGCDKWYLAYLIGNRKFDVIVIKRNEEVIEKIKNACVEFWTECIEKEIPPAPTGADIDFNALKAIYPEGEGEVVMPELEEVYDELKRYEEQRGEIEEHINKCKQEIMSAMQDKEVLIFGEKENGRPKKATWKKTEDKPVKAYIRTGSRVFRTY